MMGKTIMAGIRQRWGKCRTHGLPTTLEHGNAATHVVLMGDSIFDNRIYVTPGTAVIDQVRARLPVGARATLLAVDGSVTSDLCTQARSLPRDATHIVVSCGGNDALRAAAVAAFPAATVRDALYRMARVRAAFESTYRAMIERLCALRRPAAVCTIYDVIPGYDPALLAALCFFNDVITREAGRAGIPVIDLRLVCSRPADFSKMSPIEPSAEGGARIAAAIVSLVQRQP